VRQILLTHIHLDHAGATGSIVDKYPHIDVVVHGRGAPHLANPAKLLNSAGRLYGEDMDRLWGEVKPVPQDRLSSWLRSFRNGAFLGRS
jgi:glyoxylase-like metal-dependent hydrolase (beta-lactamase superfamily II)